MADLVVVAACTDPMPVRVATGLFVVERDTPGFVRGRQLDKIGLPRRTPRNCSSMTPGFPRRICSARGRGLQYLMGHLPQRLGCPPGDGDHARHLRTTVEYWVRDRKAYGKPIIDLQHTRFELAEMSTEIDIATAYVDASVLAYNAGNLSPVDAAKGKWYISELQRRCHRPLSATARWLRIYA